MTKITVAPMELVKAERPTNDGEMIRLTELEAAMPFWLTTSTLHAYTQSVSVNTLRTALQHVLADFIMLSGRLQVVNAHGDLALRCVNGGVGFYIATANADLRDVVPPVEERHAHGAAPWETKFPNLSPPFPIGPFDENGPAVMIQVTHFTCGGFTIGVQSYHSLVDAQTVALFLSAWAAVARALASNLPLKDLYKKPNHDRSSVYVTPQQKKVFGDNVDPANVQRYIARLPTMMPDLAALAAQLRHIVIHFSKTELDAMKATAMSDIVKTNPQEYVSIYDTLFAHLVRVLATAENMPISSTQSVSITSTVNLRHHYDPPLPANTVGSFVTNLVTHTTHPILSGTLGQLALCIKQGHQATNNEIRTMNVHLNDDNNPLTAFSLNIFADYGCIQWNNRNDETRLIQADFGSGLPAYHGPGVRYVVRDHIFIFLDTIVNDGSIDVAVNVRLDCFDRFVDAKLLHAFLA